jgi:hypothetical protein
VGQVIDAIGGKLLVNDSWSGCFVCDPYNAGVSSCGCDEGRLTNLCSDGVIPDIIIVFMGTNDRGYILPCRQNKEEINNFYGAYFHMIKRLKELYPSAEIWCMTFVYKDVYKDGDDYSQVVRDCAAEYGCKLIDLFCYPPYELFDGKVHADKQGMNDIAKIVLNELNK